MKIIHCADIHLESKMKTNLNSEDAKIRRNEILDSFLNVIEYAHKNEIGIILISGDLFDVKNISASVRTTVRNGIEKYPDIRFYYLRGNHDDDNFLVENESVPANLMLFGDEWKTYEDGIISIHGIELNDKNSSRASETLKLDKRRFNIIMLHGQDSTSSARDRAEVINIMDYRNKGIDYMALGHVHSFKAEKLDERGRYCYPGCLEGRGFDEAGEHGFAVIEIDNDNSFDIMFVNQCKREVYDLNVNISECENSFDIEQCISQAIAKNECENKDYVKINLTGSYDVERELNLELLRQRFYRDYFAFRIDNKTTRSISAENYNGDESLKGEFIRLVMDDDSISENDKGQIINYGLMALVGEVSL